MPRPQRIASLLASSTEILHALGLADSIVAISHECDYPPEIASRPRVTRTNVDAEATSKQIDDEVQQMMGQGAALYEIDVDRLAELAPELIVTQSQCDVCSVRYQDVLSAVQSRPALQGTRVVSLNPMTLGDIFDDIRNVAAAVDAEQQAKRYLAELDARVDAVLQAAQAAATTPPRVVCIEWIEPVMVAANWMPELIELAGGESGLTRAGRHSTYLDWQAIVEYDPQVIVVTPCGFDLARTLAEAPVLAGYAGWRDLAAVRSGRVYAADGNAYFNRSGPRMIDSLEILAHLILGERFPLPGHLAGTWCPLRLAY